MTNTIIQIIGFLLLGMAIFTGFILARDQEKKYPRFISYNWTVIFIVYMVIVTIGKLFHIF